MIETFLRGQLKQASLLPQVFPVDLFSKKDFASAAELFAHDFSDNEWEEKLLPNHFCNCQLWAYEDKARDPQASDETIARVKRTIDQLIQLRHNYLQEMDSYLLEQLDSFDSSLPHFSETPGSIFDRLSITELKIFHLLQLSLDEEKDENLRQEFEKKFQVMKQQRGDLISALEYLWEKVEIGEMQFKTYFQFKLYNDKRSNPYLKK